MTDPEKVIDFVTKTYKKKAPHWDSEKPKKEKFTFKMTGKDVENFIFTSKRNALVLVYSTDSFKNRGIKDKMEKFAKLYQAKHPNLRIARYSAIN